MKTFVILFRQNPKHPPLTDDEKRRRTAETAPWAARANGAGHRLDPRLLGPEGRLTGGDVGGWPVTALLFLEARDLAEAAALARSHPAVRYGSRVEVRPWSAPPPPPPG